MTMSKVNGNSARTESLSKINIQLALGGHPSGHLQPAQDYSNGYDSQWIIVH